MNFDILKILVSINIITRIIILESVIHNYKSFILSSGYIGLMKYCKEF